ncbi:unnamed protein product [Cochlearia groenlandica]
MSPTYFPLRWESTGDQWWYATPIDYAAANSQYELVRELIRIDSNNLIKLTSLRRIRRLESVWDDDSLFHDVASSRSHVARQLLLEGGSSGNTLIRSGYGGWLLYTAASAGDLGFVQDLLQRNPLLVFGEGEYGVTDILYAAARSKRDDVFLLIYDYAVNPRFGLDQHIGEIPEAYKREMKNRAVHSASRGGNLVILKQLLSGCSLEDVFSFRDKQGSTILHAAASKGKTEVVKELLASYGLMDSVDNQGNTALHVAAYRGHADLVEALVSVSPSLVYARNNAGDTFLHAGIYGFRNPSFERLDKHTELMNRLITSRCQLGDVVNYRNKEGRTALHLAISGNVPLEFVEMLMWVKSIDINIKDGSGMTPLDLIRHNKHHSPTCHDILFRRLVSAGGMFSSCHDQSITSVVASHLKSRCNFYSPGSRFKTSDAEIFLSSGLLEVVPDHKIVPRHVRSSSCSIEIGHHLDDENYHLKKCRKYYSVNSATDRLKSVFHWPHIKKQPAGPEHAKTDSQPSLETQENLVPLRQRFSKSRTTSSSSLPTINNNKRTLSVRSNQSSPKAKKKRYGTARSRSSSFSKISVHSSSTSSMKEKGVMMIDTNIQEPPSKQTEKQSSSVRRRFKSNFFCFGHSALSVKTQATVLV